MDMSKYLFLQKKCPDGVNIPCVVDSNNLLSCTCNSDGQSPVEIKGDSNKFNFFVNGSPCTLQSIKNGNVVVGTKCESTTLESAENFTFGDAGAIHSLNGGTSDVCLGFNNQNDSVILETKPYYRRFVGKKNDCPTNTQNLFLSSNISASAPTTKDNNTKDNNTKDNNTKDNDTKDNDTKDNNTKDNTKDNNTKDNNTKDNDIQYQAGVCPEYTKQDGRGPYIYTGNVYGCILKSLVYYKNSNVTATSFTPTSFNIDPVFDYVLPYRAICDSNSEVSCGYGTVCENGICSGYNNGTTCPKYKENPNKGGATFKFINGNCQYPTPSIHSGSPSNYVFNWGYGQGASCTANDECDTSKGIMCINNVCTPPPNEISWNARQENNTSCTNNNQCISGYCDGQSGKCTKVDLNGKCPENVSTDPAYEYFYYGDDLGCIVKSIIGYQNSSDFSTNQFNLEPIVNYVLPQNYNGCENSELPCGNGQICDNNICVDLQSGWKSVNYKCPILSPNPVENGDASWRKCDGICQYPSASVKSGGPNNYNFYWRYSDGCPCNDDDSECQSGFCNGSTCQQASSDAKATKLFNWNGI